MGINPIFIDNIREKLNPLNVYCRMRDCYIPKDYAIMMSRKYEIYIHESLDKYLKRFSGKEE